MKETNQKADVIFVDDEEHWRLAAEQTFELADIRVACFASAKDALERINRQFNGIVVSDIRMPDVDGFEFLQHILDIDFELPVVLVTGHGDVQMAVSAMRKGAYDFIENPMRRII